MVLLFPSGGLIFVLSELVVLVLSLAVFDDRCTLVKVLARKYNKSLSDHVAASFAVRKEDDCQFKCFKHKFCVSYNLGPSVQDGVRECEISTSDDVRDPQNMTDRPGYFYRGTKNSCSTGPCPRNASCFPNFEFDSFRCECPPGFTGENCGIDIDECDIRDHNCHINASCFNVIGSYGCRCFSGYQGDGFRCKDMDECKTEDHKCHLNSSCLNAIGSYDCRCFPGFTGDGFKCEDIDECQPFGNHKCDVFASCFNTIGSYGCRCNPGYHGDGFLCEVPPYFESFPESLQAEENDSVNFTCLANGDPKPDVTWSRQGGNLSSEKSFEEQGVLWLFNVSKEDSGKYVCTATSSAGRISQISKLSVYSILRFTTIPPADKITVLSGDPLQLPCSATSDLVPEVVWTEIAYNRGVDVFPNNTLSFGSVEGKHAGAYKCTAKNVLSEIQLTVFLHVQFPVHCSEIKTMQGGSRDTSGNYFIDPDGAESGENAFEVYCNMTMSRGVGVTVISHDSEARTLVEGFDPKGSYSRDISYSGASIAQLANLVSNAEHCQQFIKYECLRSTLLRSSYGWWVSRDGQKMTYWGGADPDSGMCACGTSKSCVNALYGCNCDAEIGKLVEDSGLLTDKTTLPVTQLRFGDASGSKENGYHTLGKLMCYGTLQQAVGTGGSGLSLGIVSAVGDVVPV